MNKFLEKYTGGYKDYTSVLAHLRVKANLITYYLCDLALV